MNASLATTRPALLNTKPRLGMAAVSAALAAARRASGAGGTDDDGKAKETASAGEPVAVASEILPSSPDGTPHTSAAQGADTAGTPSTDGRPSRRRAPPPLVDVKEERVGPGSVRKLRIHKERMRPAAGFSDDDDDGDTASAGSGADGAAGTYYAVPLIPPPPAAVDPDDDRFRPAVSVVRAMSVLTPLDLPRPPEVEAEAGVLAAEATVAAAAKLAGEGARKTAESDEAEPAGARLAAMRRLVDAWRNLPSLVAVGRSDLLVNVVTVRERSDARHAETRLVHAHAQTAMVASCTWLPPPPLAAYTDVADIDAASHVLRALGGERVDGPSPRASSDDDPAERRHKLDDAARVPYHLRAAQDQLTFEDYIAANPVCLVTANHKGKVVVVGLGVTPTSHQVMLCRELLPVRGAAPLSIVAFSASNAAASATAATSTGAGARVPVAASVGHTKLMPVTPLARTLSQDNAVWNSLQVDARLRGFDKWRRSGRIAVGYAGGDVIITDFSLEPLFRLRLGIVRPPGAVAPPAVPLDAGSGDGVDDRLAATNAPAFSLSVSPGGRWLAVAGVMTRRSVAVWDLEYSHDGAATYKDPSLREYDATAPSGRVLYATHIFSTNQVRGSADGLGVAGAGQKVVTSVAFVASERSEALRARKLARRLRDEAAAAIGTAEAAAGDDVTVDVSALTVSPPVLAAGYTDGTMCLWAHRPAAHPEVDDTAPTTWATRVPLTGASPVIPAVECTTKGVRSLTYDSGSGVLAAVSPFCATLWTPNVRPSAHPELRPPRVALGCSAVLTVERLADRACFAHGGEVLLIASQSGPVEAFDVSPLSMWTSAMWVLVINSARNERVAWMRRAHGDAGDGKEDEASLPKSEMPWNKRPRASPGTRPGGGASALAAAGAGSQGASAGGAAAAAAPGNGGAPVSSTRGANRAYVVRRLPNPALKGVLDMMLPAHWAGDVRVR